MERRFLKIILILLFSFLFGYNLFSNNFKLKAEKVASRILGEKMIDQTAIFGSFDFHQLCSFLKKSGPNSSIQIMPESILMSVFRFTGLNV